MIEHPILFSGPMVRAILGDHKTQTRRVIKTPISELWGFGTHNDGFFRAHVRNGEGVDIYIPCPYGAPGDRLWVRETFCPDIDGKPHYRADEINEDVGLTNWRPSIHMPRRFSRILLEVKMVWAERLHEITEGAAIAEGVDAVSLADAPRQATWSRRRDFAQLWDLLNAKRGYGWDTNPWVWVIEFQPVSA